VGRNAEIVQRFMSLFAGLERAHGVYRVPVQNTQDGTKVKGTAKTVHEPVTIEVWAEHLRGNTGLGVVPINDYSLCSWGAGDIDSYEGVDVEALDKKIAKQNLPLVRFKSKSGGVHLFMFMTEPTPATLVRSRLMTMMGLLGFAGVEVFPKQTQLASDKDTGNWINMPYFGGSKTDRYALVDGQPILDLTSFLNHAESRRIDPDDLEALDLDAGDNLPGGPPCLNVLCSEGFPEGSRNNALFDMGVYARKAFPDTWEAKVDEYNQKYMSPGSSEEVMAVIKSLRKKDYFYRCKELPINQYCDKAKCAKAKYGLGSDSEQLARIVTIEHITKILTDDPTYIVTVDGVNIEMIIDDLFNQNRFRKLCLQHINKYPPILKNDQYTAMVQQALDKRDEEEAPPDASDAGIFMHYVEEFCISQQLAGSRDELLLGKPWVEGGRIHFRMADLSRYLEQEKVRGFTPRKMYATLRNRSGVQHHQFKLMGKCVQAWSMPDFDRQQEDMPATTVEVTEF
jgi:hypothetical protein